MSDTQDNPVPTRMERIAAELEAALADATLAPQIKGVLRFFRFNHLTMLELKVMSMEFCNLALLVARAPAGPEVVVALRELLRAKDQGVRAVIP